MALPPALLARVFLVMTAAAVTGSLLFNFTTNGNAQLLTERFRGVRRRPGACSALLLASVYAIASLAQLVVGRLIDRVPLKPLYVGIALRRSRCCCSPPTPRAGGCCAAAGVMIFDLRRDPVHRRDDRALRR